MRTSFVSFLAGVLATTCIAAIAQSQTPKPDTGELPSNAGTVIDKTRPGPASGAKAASAPASAASGVLPMRRPAGSAPR